jgi:hypothetical protein
MLERRDFAVALPKLDVMAVHQTLGGLDSGAVIGATQVDRSDEMAIQAYDVHAIVLHTARTPHQASIPS